MSETTVIPPGAPTENVTRGAIFALAAIPIAMVAFAIVAGLFGLITGIVAIVVPYVAAFLYGKGAGAPLGRAGWGPFILIAGLAVVLGTLTGIAAQAYYAYTRVGGDSILNPAFWRTVGNQFTIGLGDNLFGILIGLGLGAAGIVGVIRGPRTTGRGSNRLTPAQVQAMEPDAAPNPTAPAPPAPPAPPAAPLANQPSPGILLNGKPIDPDQK